MYIQNIKTGEPVPYASVVTSQGWGLQADENGKIDDSMFFQNGNLEGVTMQVSSAGYQQQNVLINTALTLGGVELSEGGDLPEFVFTFVKKAKANPAAVLIIIAIVVAAVIYRKKLLSLIKN